MEVLHSLKEVKGKDQWHADQDQATFDIPESQKEEEGKADPEYWVTELVAELKAGHRQELAQGFHDWCPNLKRQRA